MLRPESVTVFFFLLIAASVAAAQAPSRPAAADNAVSSPPDVNTIIDRTEAAQEENRSHYRAYTVTREYRLYAHDEPQPNSEVVAQVNFVPPDNKTFDIKQVIGSSRGEKIVKDVLRGESDTAQHYQRTTLTRANYDFQYLGEESVGGRTCYVLKLTPKRKESDLVKGQAWIDAKTYLVHRVSGELAKSPSWWLKTINVTLDFNEVDGMWLQTGSKASAQVRWFGDHTLEARALNFRTSESVAQAHERRAVPARPTRSIGVSGEAVYIHP